MGALIKKPNLPEGLSESLPIAWRQAMRVFKGWLGKSVVGQKTDGSGDIAWGIDPTTNAVMVYINGAWYPAQAAIDGTSNQVIVTPQASGRVVLSTPQDLNAGATPEFAGVKTSAPIESTLADGGDPPFDIVSAVMSPNLNADLLDGKHAAGPGAIIQCTLPISCVDGTAAGQLGHADGVTLVAGITGKKIRVVNAYMCPRGNDTGGADQVHIYAEGAGSSVCDWAGIYVQDVVKPWTEYVARFQVTSSGGKISAAGDITGATSVDIVVHYTVEDA